LIGLFVATDDSSDLFHDTGLAANSDSVEVVGARAGGDGGRSLLEGMGSIKRKGSEGSGDFGAKRPRREL